MAIERFFIHLANVYASKASKGKNEEAARLYTEAARFSVAGDIEKAQDSARQASDLMGEMSQVTAQADAIRNKVLPEVLERLKSLGIKDPPIEFLQGIYGGTGEVSVPTPTKKVEERLARSKYNFTDKQLLVSKICFRLTGDENIEGTTLEEAIVRLYPRDEEENIGVIKNRVSAYWKDLQRKYERLSDRLGSKTLPFSDEDLRRSDFLNQETIELLQELGEQEVYKGRTLREAYMFVTTVGRGPLKTVERDEVFNRKLDLTEVQQKSARAMLRLVGGAVPYRLSVFEAVKEIYPSEEWKELTPTEMVRDKVRSNWLGARAKLEKIFGLMRVNQGEEVRLPIREDLIRRLPLSEENLQLVCELNEIPAYEGMSFERLMEYTSTAKSIVLGGSVYDRNILESTKLKTVQFLELEEEYVLALKLSERGAPFLSDIDIDRLDEIILTRGFKVEESKLNTSDVIARVKDVIFRFMDLYSEEQENLFGRLTQDQQFMLMKTINMFPNDKEQLEALLS